MEIMSFFSVGDHSGLLYSRIGRAYVMKALTSKSRCLEAKQLPKAVLHGMRGGRGKSRYCLTQGGGGISKVC